MNSQNTESELGIVQLGTKPNSTKRVKVVVNKPRGQVRRTRLSKTSKYDDDDDNNTTPDNHLWRWLRCVNYILSPPSSKSSPTKAT